MRWWALALVAGCIRSGSVVCEDGQICPEGTICAQVTNPSAELCASPDQISACVGKNEFDVCELAGATIARCYDGVCLTAGCGNGRVDPDEVCDDGNSIVGDGCSSSCQSNETCGNGIVDPVKIINGVAQPDEQCDDKNTVSGDGCSSDCQLEAPQWRQLIVSAPTVRYATAAVYDSARGRVVMFGGAIRQGNGNIIVTVGDTWEWDGTGWISAASPISPTARTGHIMAYDAARRRIVMFGGASSITPNDTLSALGDTWLYDGNNWTLPSPVHAPTPREGAAAAYDSARARVVVFGGQDQNGNPNAETWEWDGTDWTQIQTATAPPARFGHVMAYDPVGGVVVMAGGGIQDTWEYDGIDWHDVTPTNAAKRTDQISDFGMAYDRVTQQVVTNGGISNGGGTTTDTWGWNGQVWTKLLAGGGGTPTARTDPMMVGDPVRGKVILVGGEDIVHCPPPALFNCDVTLNDTWQWNGSAWNQVAAIPAPPPLEEFASAFDSWRGRFVIFGGEKTNTPTFSTTTWELAGGHWIQEAPAQSPSSRQETVMAYDSIRHQSVLFGGIDNGSTLTLSDTWTWDGTNWTKRTPTTIPPVRFSQSMAFDPVRERLVMYGGAPVGTDDTWEWDGTNWMPMNPTDNPGDVEGAPMAFDPIRQRIVLHVNNDTWEWDGVDWTTHDSIQNPGTRDEDTLAWNGPREKLELFGGGATNDRTELDDLWEWGGTSWAPQFPQAPPPGRQAHATITSPDGAGLLVFGGYDGTNVLGDLWRLRWTSNEPYELCTLDVDNDGDGLAGCADPDCWAACTPLCPPGATCDPSWPHCGDGTCGPTESCRLCPQDCGACTAVCGDTFCDAPETHATCPGDCP